MFSIIKSSIVLKHTLILILISIFVINIFSCKNSTRRNKQNIENGDVFFNREAEDTLKSDTLKLLFAGDIMVHATQIYASRSPNGEFDFISPFDSIKSVLMASDFAIANLETTLGEEPYTGYPRFKSPDILAKQLKSVGFNVLVTANNHSADTGLKGILNTISKLNEAEIQSIGTFKDSIDRLNRTPLILDKNGIKIALLSYTYSTNGIPVPKPAEVALIDTAVMSEEIIKSKKLNPDLTIVFMHWGEEYHTKPSKNQIELSKWLKDQGVDAIIGTHPHVIQPLVIDTLHNGKLLPIAYSLGNLISNQSKPGTDEGIMVELIVIKDSKGTAIKHIRPINTYCNRNAERKNRYLIEIVR